MGVRKINFLQHNQWTSGADNNCCNKCWQSRKDGYCNKLLEYLVKSPRGMFRPIAFKKAQKEYVGVNLCRDYEK